MGDTLYDVLGVAPDASGDEIRRRYRELAKELHPDRRLNAPPAVVAALVRRLEVVNAAWEVLGHPSRRAAYDDTIGGSADTRPGDTHDARHTRDERGGPEVDDLLAAVGFFQLHGFRLAPLRYRTARTLSDHHPLLAGEGADFSVLRRLAPDGLRALHAEDAPVDDRDVAHLAVLTGMRFLDLSNTHVSDQSAPVFAVLRELEDLRLWGTHITDATAAVLAGLPGLRRLNVGSTRVGDAGVRALARCVTLRELNLRETNATEAGLAALAALPDLQLLAIPHLRGLLARHRLEEQMPHTTVVT